MEGGFLQGFFFSGSSDPFNFTETLLHSTGEVFKNEAFFYLLSPYAMRREMDFSN